MNLDIKHPIYEALIADWSFFQMAYEGGRHWARWRTDYSSQGPGDQNLWQHLRESQDDFQLRINRSIYPNYCRTVVDVYRDFIFGSDTTIGRELELPDIDLFLADVDQKDSSIDDFMKRAAIYAQIYGHAAVFVDAPLADQEQVVTLRDQQEMELRPYFSLYTAPDIVDWSQDRFGVLEWVRIQEISYRSKDPFAEESEKRTAYRTWTREAWYIHDQDDQLVAEGEHRLGEVPIVMVYFQKHPSKEFVGLSALNDIAPLNRMLANTVSYIDEFVSRQAFPFLAAADDMSGAQDEEMVISAANLFQYPAEAQPPTYVSPPTDPASFMKDYVDEYLVKEIMRSASLDYFVNAAQSGLAKKMDFHRLNNVLTSFSRNLEKAETDMFRLWAKWQDIQEPEVVVDYPDDYEIEGIETVLKNAELIRKVYGDQSPAFVSQYLNQVANRLDPKMSEEEQQQIGDQLDDNAEDNLQAFATLEAQREQLTSDA